MKNKELISLYNALSVLDLKGVKFSYAVAKNLALIKPEVDLLVKAQEASDEFKKYDQERIELAKKHSNKDEKGEPKTIVKGQLSEYDIADLGAFNVEFEALKEKHKDVISSREAQLKEFQDLVEKECTVTLHKIDIDDVPQDISSAQLVPIFTIIKEE